MVVNFQSGSYILARSYTFRSCCFVQDRLLLLKIVYFQSKSYTLPSTQNKFFQEGDGIRLNTQSTVRSTNCVFPIGKEIDYKTMDGRNVKSTLEFDNNVAKVRDSRTSAARTNNKRKLSYQLGLSGARTKQCVDPWSKSLKNGMARRQLLHMLSKMIKWLSCAK